MDLEIISERENEFFKRRDLQAVVKHAKLPTPAKADVAKLFAERYGVDAEQVVIDYIFTKKGICEALVKAKILKEKPSAAKQGEKSETQAGATAQNVQS